MKLGTLLLIFILGVVVFFNVPNNGFINDDNDQVVHNPLILSNANIPKFFLGGTYFDPVSGKLTGGYYRPIMPTVYTLVVSSFGLKAYFLHLAQIIIFVLNACLVYFVLRKFLPEIVSVILAIIFLVHPINTEVAVYIADLQDVLYFFFGMLALTTVLYKKGAVGIVLANILMVLSLLSKETGALFYAPLSLITFFSYHTKEKRRLNDILNTTLSIIIIISYFIIRASIPLNNIIRKEEFPIMTVPFYDVLKTTPSILFFYLKMFIFPKDLALYHDWVVQDITISNFFIPLVVDVFFIAGIIYLWGMFRKNNNDLKTFFFFASWFIIGIFFHLQVLFRLNGTASERWFYFTSVGLLGLIGMVLKELPLHKKWYKTAFIAISIALIAILSIRTSIRTMDWKDEMTLKSHDVKTGQSAIIEYSYAALIGKKGQLKQAEYHLKKAVTMNPKSTLGWEQLGIAYELEHEFDKAGEAYMNSMKIGSLPKAYEGYARILLRKGKYKQAIEFINIALKVYPNDTYLNEYKRDAVGALSAGSTIRTQ